MNLVNFGKNLAAGVLNEPKTAQNKVQNKEVNLFSASKTQADDFTSKADFNNFFKGIELLVENDQATYDVDAIFSKKINEPDLKFSKAEPKFNLDNAYLEIDSSKLPALDTDKVSRFDSFLA